MKLFSDTLRRLRLDREWSQRKLARVAGLRHSHISAYEMGSQEPRAQTLLKLAYALECTVDFLLHGKDRSDDEVSEREPEVEPT